ncbi:MAG: amidase family protein [Gammaproteobacteria bacterium]
MNHALGGLYAQLDVLEARDTTTSVPARKWWWPSESEDPQNIFITRCEIQEHEDGPLVGMRVAVKDCIGVAGVPMTCASRQLSDFIAGVDATAVERLLDAGARIVGKTNLDEFYVDTTSETSQFGPTLNPRLGPEYGPGGSSGGSAAAVAAGVADAALGTDGAGSSRVPAVFCGLVGLKPTHGLVPTYGVADMMPSVDHVGLLADDVPTVARVLEVLAGSDPRDPASACVRPTVYTSQLDGGVRGLRVGVLKEFFDAGLAPQVREGVERGLSNLRQLGADVQECSIPSMAEALAVWMACSVGEQAVSWCNDGVCVTRNGGYDDAWLEAFAALRRRQDPQYGRSIRLIVLLGAYLSLDHGNRHYAAAMNRRIALRSDYERAFESHDLLVTPTIPMLPFKLGELEQHGGSFSTIPYTCPFNMLGAPALSVTCDRIEGRFVGMQLAGRWRDEATLLRTAHAYQENFRESIG